MKGKKEQKTKRQPKNGKQASASPARKAEKLDAISRLMQSPLS